MQAIRTHFIGPTDTKGGRIKASCTRGSLVVPWDHSLDPVGNHRQAALTLCQRFASEDAEKYGTKPHANPWSRKLAMGRLPDGSWAHVFIPAE